MKVFDLHCPQDHIFEGWFASEVDFQRQLERGLVECPMCGSKQLRKGLSAPRLNLGAKPEASASAVPAEQTAPSPATTTQERHRLHALQAAWLEASRKIAANTEDVGEKFADEALRMHKGQEPERPSVGKPRPSRQSNCWKKGCLCCP